MNYLSTYDSPLGRIFMAGTDVALTALWFEGQAYTEKMSLDAIHCFDLPLFSSVRLWLEEYFSGRNPDFFPPIAPQGTQFRQKVWRLLTEIGYGQTITYGQLADRLSPVGKSSGIYARAVGGAVAHNPISLIVPCHRVVGSAGQLTGYAAGLDRKRFLLRLEGVECK